MAKTKIYSMIMYDGSRHFASVPETIGWGTLCDHIVLLPGTELSGFVSDGVTEAWIDFTYRGHKFSVNNQFGDYWFFVEDVDCPEEILEEVMGHCEQATGTEAL